MSLVDLDQPLRFPGYAGYGSNIITAGADTLDAAGEYSAYVIQAERDMVISHLGYQLTAIGSPTADVRIETIDASGLPSGTLWATNTNIVTGTLTSNTWRVDALTAPATITKGQWFALKFVYNTGTSIGTRVVTNYLLPFALPYKVTNTTGSAVKSRSGGVIIAFGSNATTFYKNSSGLAALSDTNGTFNSSTAAGTARGLRFRMPFSGTLNGATWFGFSTNGDYNLNLLTDVGVLIKSMAFDGDYSVISNTNGNVVSLFDVGISLAANTWYRLVIEPTTATNVTMQRMNMPATASNYYPCWPYGDSAFWTTFTTAGGWVDTTDQKPVMDAILSQIEVGPGYPASRAFLGM